MARVPARWLAAAAAAAGLLAVASDRALLLDPRHEPGAPAAGLVRPLRVAPLPSHPGGVAACVTRELSRLDLDERIGQLLMVGTPAGQPARIADVVRRYHPGGTILTGRTATPASTVAAGIATLQAATAPGIPLQIALDQEGGAVQTLRGPDFPPFPPALDQARLGPAGLRAATAGWTRPLARVGVTLDLAPVADSVPAASARDNPPIGAFARQYGATPGAVAASVATVVRAAAANGLLTTLKHFPGLGRVRADPDTSAQVVDGVTRIDDPYLQPFASGIRAGVAAVMVSSARYERLDPTTLAVFSAPIITGLLRWRIGYRGLIISDDLGAAAAVSRVPVGERAVLFVAAGGDMVLTVRAADAGPMTRALSAAALASSAFAARVGDAARDVLSSKYRAGLLDCAPATVPRVPLRRSSS